jgi:cobyrinic acid a,c-diamide synthase
MNNNSNSVGGVVIAGVSSGVGKTTITAAVIRGLRQRGCRVQPCKCGPDYIDPGFLSRAAARPCRNLDSWMVPPEAMLELYHHAARDADIAVIEGVMGLYDGRNGLASEGSTAAIAKTLNAPVLLVVDAARMSASAAAVVLGYRDLDPEVNLAGVIVNNVGSENHRRWVSEAIIQGTGLPVLGCLPREEGITLPERHLGLVPVDEKDDLDNFFRQLEDKITANIDIDAIVEIARTARLTMPGQNRIFPDDKRPPVVKIAVARDAAFNFYYEDNLDILRARGAALVTVSPLDDPALPEDIDGIYIGGGFPEVFAARLSANHSFLDDLRKKAAGGMPVYAECGGMMYLSGGISDSDGREHDLAGLIPARAKMLAKRARLGYTVAAAARDSILLKCGDEVRGHLFHWSEIPPLPERAAYHLTSANGQPEGFVLGDRDNILASYLHLHFAAPTSLADNFIDACRRWSPGDGANTPERTRGKELNFYGRDF